MIASRVRESKRNKTLKLSRNLQRLYKEGKCRKCSVVVTRMDFAKILGKFTKVKIQYESVSSPKKKDSTNVTSKESTSPNNARLKSNENGMVLLPRNAYNQHPAKELKATRSRTASPHIGNVLKENNRLKKTPPAKKEAKSTPSSKKPLNSNLIKQYKIVFTNPKIKSTNDHKSKMTLSELIPLINNTLLPSLEWSIEYLPKSNDIKGDKVYDRIAAELEDLMYNEKPKQEEKPEPSDNKVDDFPSIMDILNDNTCVPSVNNSDEIKATLESSDVEAMLLGKVENTENNNVENVSAVNTSETVDVNIVEAKTVTDDIPLDRSSSPSILNDSDKTKNNDKMEVENNINNKGSVKDIQSSDKDVDENLKKDNRTDIEGTKTEVLEREVKTENLLPDKEIAGNLELVQDKIESSEPMDIKMADSKSDNENVEKDKNENNNLLPKSVTHVIFKKTIDEKCYKTVTCSKNLKYIVELDGKQVEFIGAPKFISSLEDLRVLLQIVNESELESLYVLH